MSTISDSTNPSGDTEQKDTTTPIEDESVPSSQSSQPDLETGIPTSNNTEQPIPLSQSSQTNQPDLEMGNTKEEKEIPSSQSSQPDLPTTTTPIDDDSKPIQHTVASTNPNVVHKVEEPVQSNNPNNNNNTVASSINNSNEDELLIRYRAAMILSGVGDAFGYKNGRWEFSSFPDIYKEYKQLGGYQNITINKTSFRLSDDTIMHMATAFALLHTKAEAVTNEQICELLAKSYIECMGDMGGRAPGRQTTLAISLMTSKKTPLKWNELPYSNGGGGCGGAMRAMCIGLKFASPAQLDNLIAISIESGRITHNHPVGFLGALVSALFTSYAVQNIPAKTWGTLLVDQVLPKAYEYIKATSNDKNKRLEDYQKGWDYFVRKWEDYLIDRKIPFSKSVRPENHTYPCFPEKYGFNERDDFYASISFSGWGGSSGHDSVIIAYDALLGSMDALSSNTWEEMINRSILHSGDNDSTGAIACCWYGAIYGFKDVPECNYTKLEYLQPINQFANLLYKYKL